MLVVKGKRGKSVLAQILAQNTKSICFEYHDYPVMYNSYCIDCEAYSLYEFIEYMAETFKKLNADRTHYDYLIIYTNEKEEDLKELTDWLNEHRWRVWCKNIIVMCKE